MATITRNDFANRLRERFGVTTTDAFKLVDIIFDTDHIIVLQKG